MTLIRLKLQHRLYICSFGKKKSPEYIKILFVTAKARTISLVIKKHINKIGLWNHLLLKISFQMAVCLCVSP